MIDARKYDVVVCWFANGFASGNPYDLDPFSHASFREAASRYMAAEARGGASMSPYNQLRRARRDEKGPPRGYGKCRRAQGVWRCRDSKPRHTEDGTRNDRVADHCARFRRVRESKPGCARNNLRVHRRIGSVLRRDVRRDREVRSRLRTQCRVRLASFGEIELQEPSALPRHAARDQVHSRVSTDVHGLVEPAQLARSQACSRVRNYHQLRCSG
mgnify:CR=1 FL=1